MRVTKNQRGMDRMSGILHLRKNNKFFSGLVLLLFLFFLSLVSCTIDGMEGVVTHTPTVTLTPTCLPVSLSTPDGWAAATKLFVILYDPRSTGEGYLEFESREKTQDITVFIRKVTPRFVRPGDQLAIFQLGYSSYDAAQVTRLSSYTNIPPLYNTPSPGATLTPLPIPTLEGGFAPIQATNQAKGIQTQRAVIEAQYESEYNCQKQYWNENVGATASIWNITATAEVADLTQRLEFDFDHFLKNPETLEIPFRTNELYYGGVYDGLGFATRIFQSDGAGCDKYTSCTLLIFDDMELWGHNNPDNVSIELGNVNSYIIMPDCKDIDNTACQDTITYWNTEFEKFGAAKSPQYWNGDRAEINILDAIRR